MSTVTVSTMCPCTIRTGQHETPHYVRDVNVAPARQIVVHLYVSLDKLLLSHPIFSTSPSFAERIVQTQRSSVRS